MKIIKIKNIWIIAKVMYGNGSILELKAFTSKVKAEKYILKELKNTKTAYRQELKYKKIKKIIIDNDFSINHGTIRFECYNITLN